MTRFADQAVMVQGADQAARLLREMRSAAEAATGPVAERPALLAEAEALAVYAREQIAEAAEACAMLERAVERGW